jgi:hypothetical protein
MGDEGWMSDALIFLAVIGGLFVLRVVAATWVFLWLLPDGARCPHCDADTLHVAHRGWNTLLPWFRTGWCPGCGWEGLHRRSSAQAPPAAYKASHSGQFPLSSK